MGVVVDTGVTHDRERESETERETERERDRDSGSMVCCPDSSHSERQTETETEKEREPPHAPTHGDTAAAAMAAKHIPWRSQYAPPLTSAVEAHDNDGGHNENMHGGVS